MTFVKERKRFLILLVCACAFFFGLLVTFGIDVYNDSEQYISMHIHRDPGYPLFLWILRCISPKNYFVMAGGLQAIICAWCSAAFTDYIADTFSLKRFSTFAIFMITLIPHIITPLFSVSRFVMSTGIMSEALCLPLFLLFVKQMHKACMSESKMAVWSSLIISGVLSLIRAQVSAAIILWLIVLVVRAILTKRYKKIVIYIISVVLCFGAKTMVIKTYNLIFQGHFINTTYGAVNTLTNILYASDREQGEQIEDKELQEIFYLLYDEMDEKKYNYKYVEESVISRVEHIEDVHDSLKFEVCEAGLQQYLKEQGIEDYIIQNVESDKYASALMKELLPGCFSKWLGTYLLLGLRGVIRNIAVVHPILNIYAIVIAIVSIVMMVRMFVQNRESKEAWLMLIALLTIAGISYSTALTIMCLSRYMVYGFAGFYTAAYLMFIHYKNIFLNYRIQRD